MEPWLPAWGNVPISDVSVALGHSAHLVGTPPVLRIRAVLVQDNERVWLNFACVGRLEASAPGVQLETFSADIRLGPVRLLEWYGDPGAIKSADDLRLRLAQWRTLPGVSGGYQFETAANVRRQGSGTAGWTDCPFWWVELRESVPDRTVANAPQGPFYNDKHRMFGGSVGDLATVWLGDNRFRQKNQADNAYYLALPDRRGVVKGFRAEGNKLAVAIERAPELSLRCVAERVGFRGDGETLIETVEGAGVEFTFGAAVQELRVWLITPDGRWLDEYHENEAMASWGRRASIYARPRVDSDEPYAALLESLQGGESDQVEFKAWVPLNRSDSKADELIKTVCAFANTKGGSVYIGVTDAGEVAGTGRELRRWYRDVPSDPLEQRERYVKELRKILSEGIRPSVDCYYKWIDHAGHWVLQISVPRSNEVPHSLVESGDIFVRAGATSRKARPDEYAATGAGRDAGVGMPFLGRP